MDRSLHIVFALWFTQLFFSCFHLFLRLLIYLCRYGTVYCTDRRTLVEDRHLRTCPKKGILRSGRGSFLYVAFANVLWSSFTKSWYLPPHKSKTVLVEAPHRVSFSSGHRIGERILRSGRGSLLYFAFADKLFFYSWKRGYHLYKKKRTPTVGALIEDLSFLDISGERILRTEQGSVLNVAIVN
jgi:hypothetical protein